MSKKIKKRKNTAKNKVFTINITHLLSLIPLVVFCFYKNGLLVIEAGYISLFTSLQYLVIPTVIVALSYIFEVYYHIGIKKEDNLNNVVNSLVPYMNLLCYLVCGPADKLYLTIPLLIVIDVLMKIIDTKVTINRVALYKCLLFGILVLMGSYNNMNLWESDALLKSSITTGISDLVLGLRIGEMGAISNILVILGFVVLLFNKFYKKNIAITTIITYFVVSCVLVLIGNVGFKDVIINTLSSGVLFAIIYVATVSDATPILRSGRIIYSLILGIFSAIFVNVFDMVIGVYILILILGLLCPLINKFKFSFSK